MPIHTNEGIKLQQNIQIVTDQFAHPVMFQPSVITNAPIDTFTAQESDGLDGLWIGETVELPIAAIIAVEPFLECEDGVFRAS